MISGIDASYFEVVADLVFALERADSRAHAIPRRQQCDHAVLGDKAGAAGDQNLFVAHAISFADDII